MISIADMNEVYAEHARPGGWNGTVIISARDYYYFKLVADFVKDDNFMMSG